MFFAKNKYKKEPIFKKNDYFAEKFAMEIRHLLKKNIPFITHKNSLGEVRDFLKKYSVTHFPVFDNGDFSGMISSEVIENQEDNELVNSFSYDLEFFHTDENAHWSEVIELFAKNDCSIIPVLNSGVCVGFYFRNDFAELLYQTPFLEEVGNFIVLEKNRNSFSFSEISQIVESNQAKILGIFISDFIDEMVQITLKINTNAVNEILQTFRRYGYWIVLENKDDTYLQDLKEKTDYFQKYISF